MDQEENMYIDSTSTRSTPIEQESLSDEHSEADSSSTTSKSTSQEEKDLAATAHAMASVTSQIKCTALPVSFDDNVWKVVEEYTDKQHSPVEIRHRLLAMDLPVPTSFQIANYIVQYKSQKFAAMAISQSELREVLKKFKSTPNPSTSDTPFVIQDEDIEDFSVFRFFMTTRALMGMALKETHLFVNAIDTCTWRGYPMFIVGTKDQNRRFHLIGICVCANNTAADFEFLFRSVKLCGELFFQADLKPETIVCDASAVEEGFRAGFGDDRTIVTCWYYMKRNVAVKLRATVENLDYLIEIREDLDFIQQIASRSLFQSARKLFVKKWSKESLFIKYFQSEWIDQKPNWFRGALPKGGNTFYGMGLRLADESLRNNFGKHDHLSSSEFCKKLADVIRSYSHQCKSERFATETYIPRRVIIDGYNWSRGDRYFLPEELSFIWEDRSSDSDYYSENGVEVKLVKSSKFDPRDDSLEVSRWHSLGDFKSFSTKVFEITRKREGKWVDAICTCRSFDCNNICKHVIGIAIHQKEVKVDHDLRVEARQVLRDEARLAMRRRRRDCDFW